MLKHVHFYPIQKMLILELRSLANIGLPRKSLPPAFGIVAVVQTVQYLWTS